MSDIDENSNDDESENEIVDYASDENSVVSYSDEILSEDEDVDDEDILPENNHSKFNIISNNEVYNNLEKKKKLYPYLSEFERVKVLSLRAEQIENGAPVNIVVPKGIIKSLDIARLEYKQKKTPFIVRRFTNNGFEDWKLTEFINY